MSIIVHHSSEIRYLCSVKWTRSDLQVKHFTFHHILGLQKLMLAKTHIAFLRKKIKLNELKNETNVFLGHFIKNKPLTSEDWHTIINGHIPKTNMQPILIFSSQNTILYKYIGTCTSYATYIF